MAISKRSWLLALFLLVPSLTLLFAAGCGGEESLAEVRLVAEGEIDDPDLFFDIEGDFVGPDSNAFTTRAGFGGFSIREDVVVIGGRAWVRSGGEWSETDADDPDLEDSLGLAPGRLEFWADFDVSEFAGFSGPRERVNGVNAQRITFGPEEIRLLARFFDAEEADFEGLEELEFSIWLAEDGGWPVAIRVGFVGGEEFFSEVEEDEDGGTAAENVPPRMLKSFHYRFVLAAKAEPGAAGERLRFELMLVISKVNEDIVIEPPL